MMKRLLERLLGTHLSNDEYVERLRRNMEVSHKLEILKLIGKAVGYLAIAFMVFRSFGSYVKAPSFPSGFAVGAALGFLCGIFFIAAIWQLMAAFVLPLSFHRMPRLLIEYHDLLRARQSLPSPKGSADVPAPLVDAAPDRE